MKLDYNQSKAEFASVRMDRVVHSTYANFETKIAFDFIDFPLSLKDLKKSFSYVNFFCKTTSSIDELGLLWAPIKQIGVALKTVAYVLRWEQFIEGASEKKRRSRIASLRELSQLAGKTLGMYGVLKKLKVLKLPKPLAMSLSYTKHLNGVLLAWLLLLENMNRSNPQSNDLKDFCKLIFGLFSSLINLYLFAFAVRLTRAESIVKITVCFVVKKVL